VEVCALNVAVYVVRGFMMVKIHVVVVWVLKLWSLVGSCEPLEWCQSPEDCNLNVAVYFMVTIVS
jgi:hypothetical protein